MGRTSLKLIALLILTISYTVGYAIEPQTPTLDKEAINKYNKIGNDYLVEEAYDKAINSFGITIGLYPNDFYAYMKRGSAYTKKDDFTNATSDFTRALELEPTSAEVYYYRGVMYHDSKKYDQALADYNTSIELDSINPNAYCARGYKIGRASCRERV